MKYSLLFLLTALLSCGHAKEPTIGEIKYNKDSSAIFNGVRWIKLDTGSGYESDIPGLKTGKGNTGMGTKTDSFVAIGYKTLYSHDSVWVDSMNHVHPVNRELHPGDKWWMPPDTGSMNALTLGPFGDLATVPHPKPHKRKKVVHDVGYIDGDLTGYATYNLPLNTQNWYYAGRNKGGIAQGSSYCFIIGKLAMDLLINGNFNIVVKDSGLMMVQDTSFAFLVDWDHPYLTEHPDLKELLYWINAQFEKQPYLRTDTAFQTVIHEALNGKVRKYLMAAQYEPFENAYPLSYKRLFELNDSSSKKWHQ